MAEPLNFRVCDHTRLHVAGRIKNCASIYGRMFYPRERAIPPVPLPITAVAQALFHT